MRPCRYYIDYAHSSNLKGHIARIGFDQSQEVIIHFYDAISCWPQSHIYPEIEEHFDQSSFLKLPVPSNFSYALYFEIYHSRRNYPNSSCQYLCYLRVQFAYMLSYSCRQVHDHFTSFTDLEIEHSSCKSCCLITGVLSKCYYSMI